MLRKRKRDRSYGMGSTCWDFEYFRFVRRFFFGCVMRDMSDRKGIYVVWCL